MYNLDENDFEITDVGEQQKRFEKKIRQRQSCCKLLACLALFFSVICCILAFIFSSSQIFLADPCAPLWKIASNNQSNPEWCSELLRENPFAVRIPFPAFDLGYVKAMLGIPFVSFVLVDRYINLVAIGVWVMYKERTWLGKIFWSLLLFFFSRYVHVSTLKHPKIK